MASLFTSGKFAALGPLGVLPGALLYTYAAGTLTPLATYTTQSAASPNTNPVVCNTFGQADVWLGSAAYRMILKDASGATIWDEDNIATNPGLSGFISRLTETKSVRDVAYSAVGDGTTDDTAAITSALSGGGDVILPYGYTFKITSYIQIPSNTRLFILGTVKLTDRNSGFYTSGASNVQILGMKSGKITDSAVASAYTWNPGLPVAPAIHIRSSTNVLVDGLVLSYCSAGLFHSNATANANLGSGFTITGTPCSNVTFSNNYLSNIEAGSLSGYLSTEVTYDSNFVGRSGDGGLWMMGCTRAKVLNNHRYNAPTIPSDVALYGNNILSHPGTWNDQQGMEFENCHSLLVQGNIVSNICFLPIDIKNSCSEVEVCDNFIYNPESAGIVVREGDTVKNANYRVSIHNNQIFNLGTPQTGGLNPAYGGGIIIAECYLADVSDNVIHSWAQVPGIVARGPGAYLASQYPANPTQAAVSIQNNKLWFKNTFQETVPAIGMSSSTPAAIVVTGFNDTVDISGNLIKGDRFNAADARINSNPAISLSYTSANSIVYPASAKISGNVVSNWVGKGVDIAGVYTSINSGCVINGNAISGVTNQAIHLLGVNGAVVTANNLSNIGSGSGHAAIFVEGPGGGNPVFAVCITGNIIYGRQYGGTNTMTVGVSIDAGSNCTVSHNIIRAAGTAPTSFTNPAGEIKVIGTDGFPRTGTASPSGAIYPLFIGEDYYASAAGKWWKSTAIGSTTAWTQTSN